MPRLIIIYDPNDKVSGFSSEEAKFLQVKEARLSLANDIENLDRYAIAKRLAELLLEQL